MGCRNDYEIITAEIESVSLEVTSPQYGEFLGSEGAWAAASGSGTSTMKWRR